jgi:hypothetical protein
MVPSICIETYCDTVDDHLEAHEDIGTPFSTRFEIDVLFPESVIQVLMRLLMNSANQHPPAKETVTDGQEYSEKLRTN